MRKVFKIIAIVLGIGISYLAFTYFSKVSFKGTDTIRFIDNSNIKMFDQVIKLEQFKDKVVFVDIWRTLCGPCISEFKYKDALTKKFQGLPVEFLFLASNYGRLDDEYRWKK